MARHSSQQRAADTLVHYLRTAFEAADLKWDSDNVSEVEDIVDSIVEAARDPNGHG